jgi:hypothetical protein
LDFELWFVKIFVKVKRKVKIIAKLSFDIDGIFESVNNLIRN